MEDTGNSQLERYLPQVIVATLLVGLCPILAGWGLRDSGLITATVPSIVVVIVLSVAASWVGGVIWRSRPGSGDLMFSELMLWGWVRRWWVERRMQSTLALLSGVDTDAGPSLAERKQQLTQLAAALEARDVYTHRHSRRVSRHAVMIAKGMGLSSREIAKVRTAAALHDVGKINTPRSVLNKPGRLDEAEFAIIKQHPVDGAEMVAALNDAELTAIVRHHHERLDGTGYPDRLAGDAIPVGARIIAVADTFDAITSARPYRSARSHSEAIEILAKEAGTQLDPGAVHAFQTYYSGRRPLAWWLALTNLPDRLIGWLSGGNAAAAASVSRAMVTSAMTGAVATAAVVPAPLHVPVSRPALVSSVTRLSTRAAVLGSAFVSDQLTSGVTALHPGSKLADQPAILPAGLRIRRGRRTLGRSRSRVMAPLPGTAAAAPSTTATGTDAGSGAGPGSNSVTVTGTGTESPTTAQRPSTLAAPATPVSSPPAGGPGRGKGNSTANGNGNAIGNGGGNAGGNGHGNGDGGSQGNAGGNGNGNAIGAGGGNAGGNGGGNAGGNANGNGDGGSQGNAGGNGNAIGAGGGNAGGNANGASQGNAGGNGNGGGNAGGNAIAHAEGGAQGHAAGNGQAPASANGNG